MVLFQHGVPSGNLTVASEALAIGVVSFPVENAGSFHTYVNVYQMVPLNPGVDYHCHDQTAINGGEGLSKKAALSYTPLLDKPII